MEKRNLPTIQELRDGDLMRKGEQTQLSVILNAEPPKQWLKEHPFAKREIVIDGIKKRVPVLYLPIERVEYLLTRIFISWNVDIKSVQMLANSVLVTIRLYYQDVFSDKMLWQDGLGSAPLQTDKNAGAIDFNKIKNDAVMKAAPAAESYAVKDAAEKIGKLFGKDLNRADRILYDSLVPKDEENKHADLFDEPIKNENNE